MVVYINQNSTVNMHKCNKSTSVKQNVEDYAEPCIINSYEKPLKKNMAKIFPLNDCCKSSMTSWWCRNQMKDRKKHWNSSYCESENTKLDGFRFVLKQCFISVSRLSPRATDDAIREEAHHDLSPLPLPDAGGLDWNNLVHTATKAFTGNNLNCRSCWTWSTISYIRMLKES